MAPDMVPLLNGVSVSLETIDNGGSLLGASIVYRSSGVLPHFPHPQRADISTSAILLTSKEEAIYGKESTRTAPPPGRPVANEHLCTDLSQHWAERALRPGRRP